MRDRGDACDNKDEVLQDAADNERVYGINKDDENMKARTRSNGDPIPMNEYISELRPFGSEGPKWQAAFDFLRVKVHKLNAENDEDIHVLAVHGAPCKVFESRPNIPYDDEEANKMALAALEMDFIKEFFRRIRTGDATPVTLDTILSNRIEDDISYAFSISAADLFLTHLCPKASIRSPK